MNVIQKIQLALVFPLILLWPWPGQATNFVVSDTSLNDHGNVNSPTSIAAALSGCAQSGGGTVTVLGGTYSVRTGLQVGQNCRLVGSGTGATTLQMNSLYFDLITVASGRNSVSGNWAVEDLTLQMPDSSNHNFLTTVPLQANRGTIRNVTAIGGGASGWGLDLDGVLVLRIDGFTYLGGGNGIIWQNSNSLAYNVGDSYIVNSTVVLSTTDVTGIALMSPIPGNYRVNNIELNRIEVQAPDGVVRSGTIGIHLRNAARISLHNVDLEQIETGLMQESSVGGGGVATTNSFIQVFPLGCTNDYVEIGTKPKLQTIIGGQGAFANMQRLSSSDVFADHAIMGQNRVLTAVRPIEAYADPSTPRVLTVADSGKVFTNKNATGTVTFVLPAANLSYSVEYEFHLATSGQAIRVQTTGGDIIRPGQTQGNKYYQSGLGYGQVLKIRNIDNTTWSVLQKLGQWTSQ